MQVTETLKSKIIPLEDGDKQFLVEAVVLDDDQIKAVGAEAITEKSFGSALNSIRSIVASVTQIAIPENVQEAEVELGFQFDASGSIYLVSTKASASIKLKLKLKR